jgi:hypothetical protein
MLIGLLIRKGSILKAKLRIAKRLGKARAMTLISPYKLPLINKKDNIKITIISNKAYKKDIIKKYINLNSFLFNYINSFNIKSNFNLINFI